jgi:hypothetical protein
MMAHCKDLNALTAFLKEDLVREPASEGTTHASICGGVDPRVLRDDRQHPIHFVSKVPIEPRSLIPVIALDALEVCSGGW